jgi:hypothetical protein
LSVSAPRAIPHSILRRRLLLVFVLAGAGLGRPALVSGAPPRPRAGALYRVIRVPPGDTLKLRQRPDPTSAVVTDIYPEQRGLRATGRVVTIAHGLWREIVVAGQAGWVNDRFLEPDRAAPPDPLPPPMPPPRPIAAAPRIPPPVIPPRPVETPVAPQPSGQAANPRSAGAVARAALDPFEPLGEDLHCGGAEPRWIMDLLTTGELRPDEGLGLPPDARVTSVQVAVGRRDALYVELSDSRGRRILTLFVRETGNCQLEPLSRFKYEVFLKREGGEFIPGCCNRLGSGRPLGR